MDTDILVAVFFYPGGWARQDVEIVEQLKYPTAFVAETVGYELYVSGKHVGNFGRCWTCIDEKVRHARRPRLKRGSKFIHPYTRFRFQVYCLEEPLSDIQALAEGAGIIEGEPDMPALARRNRGPST